MFFIGKNEIWNSLGILHIPKMPTLWSSEVNNVMRCAIWYHLYNLKNVSSTHGGVLILVKLQAEACNFTRIMIGL